METLLQKLVKKLVCISCSSQLKPPLKQCSMGHFCCEKCVESGGKCPAKCQSERGAKREYLLEKVCFDITLKCSFASAGCHFEKIGILVAKHEETCKYSSIESENLVFEEYTKETSRQCEKGELNLKNDLDLSKTYNHNMQGSQDQSVEEAILAELECPVCLMQISPPIFECANSHRICGKCFHRLEICPVCRGSKSSMTNSFLEEIYFMLNVPCKNFEYGCEFRGRGDSIMEHEKSCRFVSGSCPLKWMGMCTWQGLMSEIQNHCKIFHSLTMGAEYRNKFRTLKSTFPQKIWKVKVSSQRRRRCSWFYSE